MLLMTDVISMKWKNYELILIVTYAVCYMVKNQTY